MSSVILWRNNMKRLFATLEAKKKKRKAFENSEEFKFFIENRHLLGKFNKFSFLYDSEGNEFNMMRANVIIYGLINKQTIELEVKSLKEYGKDSDEEAFNAALRDRCIDLPYFSEKELKIYIPFFNRALNQIYTHEPLKLLEEPYAGLEVNFQSSSIDPFDTYGAELFNSFFTKLVKVGTNGKEIAYFHYDTNTVYIVNDQGRLDSRIVLFDKYIKKPNLNHMLERITPVIEKYFNDDREGFINALLENKFISNKMYQLIK